MAAALGQAWARAGHIIMIGGRSAEKAAAIVERLGPPARVMPPRELARSSDVVVVAVAWEGLRDILTEAEAPNASMTGKPVIDCTNAVDYPTGLLKPRAGSAAQLVAELAVGAHVVKALHLFAGQSWLDSDRSAAQPIRTVAMCGDDPSALDAASALVRDLGGQPAVLGGLDRARQLEDVAGFIIRLVSCGFNPATAVPSVAVQQVRRAAGPAA
jgi:predicted dinucleotide-binding enzyme